MKKNNTRLQLRHECIPVCPAVLSGERTQEETTGYILGAFGGTVRHLSPAPYPGAGAAVCTDSAVTGSRVMATTKLWHIRGRLKDLVDYVENPDKTAKQGLQDFSMCLPTPRIPTRPEQGSSSLPSIARRILPFSR